MDTSFAYQGSVNVTSEASYPLSAKDGTGKTSSTTAISHDGASSHKDVRVGLTSSTPLPLSAQSSLPSRRSRLRFSTG